MIGCEVCFVIASDTFLVSSIWVLVFACAASFSDINELATPESKAIGAAIGAAKGNKDAIDATPYGQYLHVGGDEVKVIDRNGKKGFELNLLWLNKVSEFAKQNNRIPIFWDDMYLKHGGVWMVTRNTKLTKEKELN